MHDQPEVPAAALVRVLRRRVQCAAARRGHDRARHAAGGRRVLHRQGRQHRGEGAALPGRRARPRPRPGALQHLLHAVPRLDRRPAAAWWSSAATGRRRRSTTSACGWPTAGYYFDVITNGFGAMPDYRMQLSRARSLGGGGLHPRAATEPARRQGRRPWRRSDHSQARGARAGAGETLIQCRRYRSSTPRASAVSSSAR